MAKTKGKRSKVEKPLKEGQAQITIAPDYSHAFPTFYSNYIQVSHTGSEAFLDYCLLALPYNLELDEKRVTTPVVARIIIPPAIMTGLIKALEDQATKQQETAKAGVIALPIHLAKKTGE